MAYWGVRLGKGGQYADLARELGFIAIGWEELGDLSWLAEATDEREAREKLHELFSTKCGQTGMKASIAEGQLWRFVREIRTDDVILVPHVSQGLVHIGTVVAGLEYVAAPTTMAKSAATTKKTKPLSKAETLKAIAHAVGEEVAPKHVKAVIEHLVAVAHKELKKTGAFVLHGLAKFTAHKKPARPAREGINPFTKQKQMFAAKPASKAVRARPVKAVKDAVK
jgi:predicted Mrr-cat superfamily restriction endonuclease